MASVHAPVQETNISGKREAERLNDTGLDCYAATSSRFQVGHTSHSRHVPLIDLQQQAAIERPLWPNGAPFAVCLTHDVDNVAWMNPRMHARRMVSQMRYLLHESLNRRALGAWKCATRSFIESLVSGNRSDPLHCYEQWLELEADFSAKSTFLFLPDSYHRPHYSDGGYRYADRIVFDGHKCLVREMMREIHDRGWEVGLHASWYCFNCLEELKRQKCQVEEAINATVASVRHHFLHFDIRCTPRVHHDAGLKVDSSIGFNDDIGFRYGTAMPWKLRDTRDDRELQVIELPLVIQEKCLIRLIAEGNERVALQRANTIAKRVRDVGGVLTLLWHPVTIRQPLYVNIYRKILESLSDQGAWFGTMSEIANWWTKEQVKWT